jgi:hypothetical protein
MSDIFLTHLHRLQLSKLLISSPTWNGSATPPVTGKHFTIRLLRAAFRLTMRSVAALTQSRDALARTTEGEHAACAHSATCGFSHPPDFPAEMSAKFTAANAAVAEVSASDVSLK